MSIFTRPVIALAATVSLAVGFTSVAVSADATAKPTHADKVAMVKANRVCEPVEEEVQFEDCVIGEFVLQRQRYIDGRYFTTDFGRDRDHQIVLTRHSRKV